MGAFAFAQTSWGLCSAPVHGGVKENKYRTVCPSNLSITEYLNKDEEKNDYHQNTN